MRQTFHLHQSKRIFAAEKVRQHHNKRNPRADSCCKPCAVDAHPAGKYENVIAKNIERAAGQHAQRGKAGIGVVSQKCRQHLIQQKQREHPLNRAHVFPSQRRQRFIRAEESQNRPLKAQESRPCQQGQNRRTNDCRCEILVLAAVLLFTAALRAENDAAADAHQQAQTVDNIPDRRNDRQRRRSLRAVILPHHRRIHNGIHRDEVWRIVGHKGLRVEWNAPHPNWELYQVICGEVRLTTPDETVTAKPGELLRIPPYCTHSLEVLTDECELADMGCSIRLLNLLEDLRSMENAGEALPDAPAQRSCLLRRYGCFVTQWQYQDKTVELYPGRVERAEKEPSLPKR